MEDTRIRALPISLHSFRINALLTELSHSICTLEMRLYLASALGLLPYLVGVWGQDSAMDGMQNARNIQREQLQRMQDFLGPPPPPPPTKPGSGKGSTVTFKNPAAKQFLVDGTKIPDGMSFSQPQLPSMLIFPFSSEFRCWSILVRINAPFRCEERDTKTLLLVSNLMHDMVMHPQADCRFWPANNPADTKDLTFWTNGSWLPLYFDRPILNHVQGDPVAPVLKDSCRKMDLYVSTTSDHLNMLFSDNINP